MTNSNSIETTITFTSSNSYMFKQLKEKPAEWDKIMKKASEYLRLHPQTTAFDIQFFKTVEPGRPRFIVRDNENIEFPFVETINIFVEQLNKYVARTVIAIGI